MRGGKLTFLLVLILVISGCGQTTTKTNIGGVDMEFLESQPLIECIDSMGYCLDENAAFNVGIKLINNLPHKVDGASVCISDVVSDSIGGIPGDKPCIDGISIPPAQEESDNKVYPGTKDIYFPEGGGSYSYRNLAQGTDKTSIYAELTYPVDSSFKIADVCVKSSPSVETDFACESKETFSGDKIESDKSPVVVDRVVKSIVSIPNNNQQTKVRLIISLRKATQGDVFWDERQDKTLLMDVSLGNNLGIFACSGVEGGRVVMNENMKDIQCEAVVKLNGQNAFKEALNIRLQHNYNIILSTGTIYLKEGIS